MSEPTNTERCGLWLQAGGHRGFCMRDYDHDGPCRPLRSDLMKEIDWHDEQAAALTKWITEADKLYDLWPYYGPADERP